MSLDEGFTAAGAVRLTRAEISGALCCDGAHLGPGDHNGNALVADGIKVGGDVSLGEGFTAAGAVQLGVADIAATLSCDGAHLTGRDSDGYALAAGGIKVGGDVSLGEGFTAAGAVQLGVADIAGELRCGGAWLIGTDSDGYALAAGGIKARSGVFLTGEFTAAGAVWLADAEISGQLRCDGAHLTGRDSDGYALAAAAIKCGNVSLGEGFTAAGAVCLSGAHIAGVLLCSGARLTGRDSDGYALAAGGIKCEVVSLGEGFTAAGAVQLGVADIAATLSCDGAHLTGRDSDGYALAAAGIKVGQDVSLGEGFTAAGAVCLTRADITGQLRCDGAHLGPGDHNGNALIADGMKVGDAVFLDGGFTAAGALRLLGADIIGPLRCHGAHLTGTDSRQQYALYADGMKVGGGVFLDRGFTAAGTVRLLRADIAGGLRCSGAQLTGADSDGNVLYAYEMKVGGDVYLDGGFTAAGTVSLASAHVGASLHMKPTELADEDKVALNASGAQIGGTLEWAPAEQVRGQVNLQGAAVGELIDDWSGMRADANGYWPSGGRLKLDGFTYGRFGAGPQATVDQRLAWIHSQYCHSDTGWHGYATQPYEQLATVYRKAGQDDEARKVAIARRADLRKYVHLNPYRRFGNWFLDWTIKYGHRTWRAGVGLAAVFLVFLVFSFLARQHHLMEPVGNTAGLPSLPSATQCTSSYPCFYPVGYTIDTVIPLINVHQAAYWGPDGHTLWGHVWAVGTWVATVLGWALATLLVAGYTGLVRRD